MKYGKIYTYKDIEEAKKLIGKKVIVSDIYYEIIEEPNKLNVLKLESVRDCNIPFYGFGTCHWQFMREIEEEDELALMTNRQLSEWLARGNGHMAFANKKGQINPLEFIFTYYDIREKEGDKFVSQDICIRPWGSHDWIVPTVEIYERDCK